MTVASIGYLHARQWRLASHSAACIPGVRFDCGWDTSGAHKHGTTCWDAKSEALRGMMSLAVYAFWVAGLPHFAEHLPTTRDAYANYGAAMTHTLKLSLTLWFSQDVRMRQTYTYARAHAGTHWQMQ